MVKYLRRPKKQQVSIDVAMTTRTPLNPPVTHAQSENDEQRKVWDLPERWREKSVDGVDSRLPVKEAREEEGAENDC